MFVVEEGEGMGWAWVSFGKVSEAETSPRTPLLSDQETLAQGGDGFEKKQWEPACPGGWGGD